MTQPSQNTNERMRPWITPADKAAVMAALDRGDLMSGREVAAFEEELAAYFGKRHAVCVSSGTAALECAMYAGACGRTISPHNFIAMASAQASIYGAPVVSFSGANADLLGEQWGPCNDRVHDCAHSFNPWSARGEMSCFSFNANKFIACCGGAMVTNNEGLATRARIYRNHGRTGSECIVAGRHYRMPEINAALGRSQLKRIDEILARRKQVARWYDEITGRKLADTRESWFLFPVPNAPALAKKHRSLVDFRLFDTATKEDRETALLPIWPLMTREDCEEVCRGSI